MLKPRLRCHALKDPEGFRHALGNWFAAHAKDYPWRRTEDPYAILISEVMLQQTQIATVLGRGYYERFLAAFPDVASLAAADDERLLKTWEGLGYYRRARMLRETARAVQAKNGFPRELAELLSLPGVGPYTAGALRSFAWNLPSALVDGNVARVLSRVMDFSGAVDDNTGLKQLWRWAEELADPTHPRIHNAALMELGQTLCRPGAPNCLSCPVAEFCATRKPESLPVKKGKTKTTSVDEHALWILDSCGRLLMHRESAKRREGLWKLPTRELSGIPQVPVLTELTYAITRYRVTLRVHDGASLLNSIQLEDGESWIARDEVLALAMASPFRRAVERLFDDM